MCLYKLKKEKLLHLLVHVREIQNSPYPNLKGLEFKNFRKQLDFLEKNFNFFDPNELFHNKKFKENSCILTFDDGFKDHIEYVLPELKKRKIKGIFFPPALPIENQVALDVHLIHFILEKTKDIKKLNLELFKNLKNNNYSDRDIEKLWNENSYKNNYDNAEVSFFKRVLQKILPIELRKKIINKLFKEICEKSLEDFSKELYLNKKEILQMIDEGMLVGSHTYNHYWLNTLSKKEQNEEIDLSINFLKNLNLKTKNWIMCYPYGAYNKDTISLLKSKDCSFAFTTKSGASDLLNEPYELKRKDTTEFPS